MSKVKSIKTVGYAPVFNMEVEDNHNFSINNGIIVHNCDSLRYYCTSWTFAPDPLSIEKLRMPFDFSRYALEMGEYAPKEDNEQGYINMDRNGWFF